MSPRLFVPSALLISALAAPAPAAQPPQEVGPAPEQVHRVQVLDNGDFALSDPDHGPGSERIPWWYGNVGPRAVKRQADTRWLKLEALEASLEQPFAVYAPWIEDVQIQGLVRGHYPNLTLVDASGRELTVELERQLEPKSFIGRPDPLPFRVRLGKLAEDAGRTLEPRLRLRLGPVETVKHPTGYTGPDKVYWTNLEVLAPMPLPTPEALEVELVRALDGIFGNYFERGLDRKGPRATGFIGQVFDVVTGEPLRDIPGGWVPLWEYVMVALERAPDGRWAEAFDAFCADYFELGFHPETGLPRKWDCALDVPLDDQPVEVRADLRFLLDLHEHGPERWRERALEAARGVGAAVLAHGVLPDGGIAPSYVPRTGAYSLDAPPLRALNLPAQLGRLGAVLGEPRFTEAARRALFEFEHTAAWGGSWDSLDPDFDDRFGTFGEDAVTLLSHHPDDELFERVIRSGWEHFAPLWRASIRYGGSAAADQVRCWELLADYAELRPEIRAELTPLLVAAARAHLKGQQYPGGAFGDVTHVAHAPAQGLGVGDLPGAPFNLLWGLATLHRPELGLDQAELSLSERDVRALFTAVLRSTLEVYGREHGILGSAEQAAGANPCGQGMRLCKGLVTMLGTLER